MGIVIRDERQLQAFTGLSQTQFDQVLPIFSEVYTHKQQQAYQEGVALGTRRRHPGGGSKGKLPTLADNLLFVLYYYKTYPTFDVLGTQFEMVRSKANENLHKLSPVLHATLVRFGLMPHREFKTPEEVKAAVQGVDQVIIDATERAYCRSQEDAKQREHSSGKKTAYAEEHHHVLT